MSRTRSETLFLPLPARTDYLSLEILAGEIRFAEVVYPPGLYLPEHSHAKPSMTFSLAGSFVESRRGSKGLCCDCGSLLVRPAGEPHSDRIGEDGVRNLEIEFQRSWAEACGFAEASRRAEVLRHPLISELTHRIKDEMPIRDSAQRLVLEGLALELAGVTLRLGAISAAPRRPAQWLSRVRTLLEETFREELSISTLASEAGVHPVHLARAFRAHYRISPGSYVRRLRIRWAAETLRREPARSITDIALEAGFYDHSHFARTFRAVIGLTPSRYRNRRRD